MAQAFVIEISDRTAGVAVRETEGFRFYASDALFESLARLTFPKLRNIEAGAESILAASRRAARPAQRERAVADEALAYALSSG